MSYGHPDWGAQAATRVVIGVQDMAELAARLGSIVTFERGGQVVWLDDFEDNIAKWTFATTGMGGSATLSTEAARNGAKSCKLVCGMSEGGLNLISRDLPVPVASKVGVEYSFSLGQAIRQIEIYSNAQVGSWVHIAHARYRPQQDDLQYADSGYNWVTLETGLNLNEDLTTFHTWKLVHDLETAKWVRLILNNQTFDLATVAIRQEPIGAAPLWRVAARVLPDDAVLRFVYIEDFICTQNET